MPREPGLTQHHWRNAHGVYLTADFRNGAWEAHRQGEEEILTTTLTTEEAKEILREER